MSDTIGSGLDEGLHAADISVGYGERRVISGLDISVPTGELTVIVGPNASGKSTLLRALARMVPLRGGQVFLNGVALGDYRPKALARELGMLPQSPIAPEGISVYELVSRGRYPHQAPWRQWSSADEQAVHQAMERAGVAELSERQLGELSGGQRQRVWIALALAQETKILLLDEPTTFLDIAHQVEVLNLARDLYREGYTVVVVLHELSLAFRYASNLVVMKDGAVVRSGPVEDVVTVDLIEDVYGIRATLLADPVSGRPLVVPLDD